MGLDLDYFWSINPKILNKHKNVFERKNKDEIYIQDKLNHFLGMYISYAVNSPSDYPKKAFLEETEDEIMTEKQLEQRAKEITLALGGKVE